MSVIRSSVLAGVVAAALLVSGAASACQLICMKTKTLYNGALGGLIPGPTGADAKCEAEFGAGFKVPRSVSLVTNMSGNTGASNSMYYLSNAGGYGVWDGTTTSTAWAGAGRSSVAVDDCSGWTSNSPLLKGGTLAANGPPGLTSRLACDQQLPLLCCNM